MKSALLFSVAFFLISGFAFSADKTPPLSINSPTRRYQLTAIRADKSFGLQILVKKGGKQILSLQSQGWINDALWSPDGRFLAINNHTAAYGDYLWLIDLASASVLKRPNQPLPVDLETILHTALNVPPDTEIIEGYLVPFRWTRDNKLILRSTARFLSVDRYAVADSTWSVVPAMTMQSVSIQLKSFQPAKPAQKSPTQHKRK